MSESLRIRKILREGEKHGGRLTISYVLPGRGGVTAAYVVSKKLGGAVTRNRIKRLLRAAFRAAAKGIEGNAEFVIFPRGWRKGTKVEDLIQEIAKFIKDAGLGSK